MAVSFSKSSEMVVAQFTAFAIPILFGAYWAPIGVEEEVKAMLLRVALTGLVSLLLLMTFRAPLTRAELFFAALFGGVSVLLLVPTITATDSIRAFKDDLKLVLLFPLGLGMSRALRNERIAKTFGWAMLLGSGLAATVIVAVYVQHMGFTFPGFDAARKLKGLAMREGIALNPMGFTAFFMLVLGLCLVPPRKIIWGLAAFVFIASSCLTGSRAPVAIMLLSALLALLLHMLRHRKLALRVSGWLSVILLVATIAGWIAMTDAKKMSSIAEGRNDLWPIAWSKFQERPISGFGYESWRDDLLSRFAGDRLEALAMEKNPEGGYHNQYLTLLAEQGLVVFIPVLIICFSLLRSCAWLALRQWIPALNRNMIMLGCLFMLLRAGVEVPGLFGYANDPADYLAYCFLAVVISRLSLHEDHRRVAVLSEARRSQAATYSQPRVASYA